MKINKLKNTLLLVSVFFTQLAIASNVKIENIELKKSDSRNQVIIHLDRELNQGPALDVRSNIIQLEIPGSYVWPRIEKEVSLDGSANDAKLMAYQFEKDVVRFRVVTSHDVSNLRNQVSIVDRGNRIELSFPRSRNDIAADRSNRNRERARKDIAATRPEASPDQYDESYLEQLLKERGSRAQDDKVVRDDFFSGASQSPIIDEKEKDEVSVILSAGDSFSNPAQQGGESTFSIASYIGKFVAFLGLVLVLFYGVVTIMKKGVLRRGRLSLFNDTNIVEVLNTTYVGPKRSLMLVKAHKQVFLVASSEKGFEFLSEVKDVSGLFKSGEKEIAGANFDTSLVSAEESGKSFKFKDVATQDEGLSKFLQQSESKNSITSNDSSDGLIAKIENGSIESSRDQVKLSDQIKNKVKGLKSLQ